MGKALRQGAQAAALLLDWQDGREVRPAFQQFIRKGVQVYLGQQIRMPGAAQLVVYAGYQDQAQALEHCFAASGHAGDARVGMPGPFNVQADSVHQRKHPSQPVRIHAGAM